MLWPRVLAVCCWIICIGDLNFQEIPTFRIFNAKYWTSLDVKKSMVCTSFAATLQRSNTILELGQKKIHASIISDSTKKVDGDTLICFVFLPFQVREETRFLFPNESGIKRMLTGQVSFLWDSLLVFVWDLILFCCSCCKRSRYKIYKNASKEKRCYMFILYSRNLCYVSRYIDLIILSCPSLTYSKCPPWKVHTWRSTGSHSICLTSHSNIVFVCLT